MSLVGCRKGGQNRPSEMRRGRADSQAGGNDEGIQEKIPPRLPQAKGWFCLENDCIPACCPFCRGDRAVKRAGGAGRPQRRAGSENGSPGGMSLLGCRRGGPSSPNWPEEGRADSQAGRRGSKRRCSEITGGRGMVVPEKRMASLLVAAHAGATARG